ncbi:MAG: ankyrin repeat domain-containing protein [Oscillospiraceae bacterium]|nr:ankyrin repeat domain-containing protein [Oscillospiraceae bacterium]
MKIKKYMIAFFVISTAIILLCITYTVYIHKKTDQLVDAIRKNDVEKVIEIVSNCNSCVNQLNSLFPKLSVMLDYSVLYPLQFACETGNYEIVQILIDYGADVNCIDPTIHSTPLIMALSSMNQNRFEIANLLIESGADVIVNADDHGENALAAATCLSLNANDLEEEASLVMFDKIVDVYIANDINIKEVLCNCYNVYFFASKEGNLKVVEYLLEHDIFEVDETSKNGGTALMQAVRSNKETIVQFLMEQGANPDIVDDSGNSAHDYAIQNGNQEIIELLIRDDNISDREISQQEAETYIRSYSRGRI